VHYVQANTGMILFAVILLLVACWCVCWISSACYHNC